MAYLLPHLSSGWEVDQAIVSEEDRVVVIRFGRDAGMFARLDTTEKGTSKCRPGCSFTDPCNGVVCECWFTNPQVTPLMFSFRVATSFPDPTCMIQDEVLARIAEKVKNFAVIYLVDIDQVPDFNSMYELYDDCTTMFFFRNKHIMCDLGTGDNNKINWALTDKQELIDIIEIVYRGARKGRGLVISPKDYSTKYRY